MEGGGVQQKHMRDRCGKQQQHQHPSEHTQKRQKNGKKMNADNKNMSCLFLVYQLQKKHVTKIDHEQSLS